MNYDIFDYIATIAIIGNWIVLLIQILMVMNVHVQDVSWNAASSYK